MNKDTKKRIANLNGNLLMKAASMTKTLVGDDDFATAKLAGQISILANDIVETLRKYPEDIPCVVPGESDDAVSTAVIADKIDEKMPAKFDLHTVDRSHGKVTAYFEATDKSYMTEADIPSCTSIITDAGMKVEDAKVINNGATIAVDLVLDRPNGNPILASEDDQQHPNLPEENYIEPDADEETDEPAEDEPVELEETDDGESLSAIPTREMMLEAITLTVARAVDVVNRHIYDQKPSRRKLYSAIGFKKDLEFLVRRRFGENTKEYRQAKMLLGAIELIKRMLGNRKYYRIDPIPAYKA